MKKDVKGRAEVLGGRENNLQLRVKHDEPEGLTKLFRAGSRGPARTRHTARVGGPSKTQPRRGPAHRATTGSRCAARQGSEAKSSFKEGTSERGSAVSDHIYITTVETDRETETYFKARKDQPWKSRRCLLRHALH